MNLITGMPRCATTFIVGVFEELGHRMTPKCWSQMSDAYESQAKGEFHNVCEPIALARAVSRGVRGLDLVKEFNELETRQWKEKDVVSTVVFKLSQLAFLRAENAYFDNTIICIREIDSWLGSAKHHNTKNWLISNASFLKRYKEDFDKSENPLRLLGEIWRRESIELYDYLKEKGKNPLIYECGDDKSLEIILKKFGISDITKHSQLKCWNGIRF